MNSILGSVVPLAMFDHKKVWIWFDYEICDICVFWSTYNLQLMNKPLIMPNVLPAWAKCQNIEHIAASSLYKRIVPTYSTRHDVHTSLNLENKVSVIIR